MLGYHILLDIFNNLLAKYNSRHKIHPVVYNSMIFFSRVTELCNHHPYTALEPLCTSFHVDMCFQFSRSGAAASCSNAVNLLNEL